MSEFLESGTRATGLFVLAPRSQGQNGTSSNKAGASSTSLSPFVDYGPQVNFTMWLLTALAAMFLALRLYCKSLRHRGLWWDDWVLVASWLALTLSNTFVSVSITMGFGQPLYLFNFKLLEPFLLINNLAGTFSILSALWSKTSFAITILRISSGWLKWLVWFIIITVNLALGLAIAFTWGQCTPIEKIWQPKLEGECWPKSIQIKYNIFTAIYSGAMDIVLAVVPWKIIWTLTMNKREKFGVLVAMSMGVFAGVTSIIKLTQLPTIGNSNFTDSPAQLVIFATAECAISIIAASIPILRALLREARPPPGPAQFYHGDFDLYTGTENSRGTGRSNTIISSGNRSTSRTSAGKDSFRPTGHFRQLSKLSRMSGLSMGFIPSNANSRRNSFEFPDLPPGKIIQTEEIVVEYEQSRAPMPPIIDIGKAF
ncbi:hypothetical protein QBC39DRAFT_254427 [Podospora conica]|nr:hypothetical protein QBC39DRAFT_254427 [Schizothecium conicum]